MFARIEKNKVVELLDVPSIDGLFHPDLHWVPCAADARIGDVLVDGVVVSQDYYAVQRAATPAYKNHAEQLGALVKAIQALIAGQPIPPDALAVFEAINQVKAEIPKP